MRGGDQLFAVTRVYLFEFSRKKLGNKKNHIIEFTIVFNRLKKRVYNYLLKMTSDRLTAEDIAQNVFLKLYEKYGEIEDKSKVDIWVFKVAKNEAYNFYRGKRARVDQFDVADSDEIDIQADYDVLRLVELKEMKEKLEAELEEIPLEQKEVFVLKESGGLTYSEISSVLGIEEDLVRSRLHSARKKLIKRLSHVFR